MGLWLNSIRFLGKVKIYFRLFAVRLQNKRQILKHFGYKASGKGYARLTNLLKNNPEIQFQKADPEGIEPSI